MKTVQQNFIQNIFNNFEELIEKNWEIEKYSSNLFPLSMYNEQSFRTKAKNTPKGQSYIVVGTFSKKVYLEEDEFEWIDDYFIGLYIHDDKLNKEIGQTFATSSEYNREILKDGIDLYGKTLRDLIEQVKTNYYIIDMNNLFD